MGVIIVNFDIIRDQTRNWEINFLKSFSGLQK